MGSRSSGSLGHWTASRLLCNSCHGRFADGPLAYKDGQSETVGEVEVRDGVAYLVSGVACRCRLETGVTNLEPFLDSISGRA